MLEAAELDEETVRWAQSRDYFELFGRNPLSFDGRRAIFDTDAVMPGRAHPSLKIGDRLLPGSDIDVPTTGLNDVRLEFSTR